MKRHLVTRLPAFAQKPKHGERNTMSRTLMPFDLKWTILLSLWQTQTTAHWKRAQGTMRHWHTRSWIFRAKHPRLVKDTTTNPKAGRFCFTEAHSKHANPSYGNRTLLRKQSRRHSRASQREDNGWSEQKTTAGKINPGECRGVVVPIFLSPILRFKEERKESQFVGTPLTKSPKSGIAALSKWFKDYGTLSIYHRLMLISVFKFLDLHRFLATPSCWRYNHEGGRWQNQAPFQKKRCKSMKILKVIFWIREACVAWSQWDTGVPLSKFIELRCSGTPCSI